MHGKRLNILLPDEARNLYGIPLFDDEERPTFFHLAPSEKGAIEQLTNETEKINFILQLGYFKAKQCFFNFTFQECRQDVWHIIQQHLPGSNFPKKRFNKNQHYKNQKTIMELFNYRQLNMEDKYQIKKYSKSLAKRHVYPKFIFEELLNFFHEHKIIKPAYSSMQLIVSEALKEERQRILRKMTDLLDKEARSTLDNLLKNEGTFYNLTLLKKDPKDFRTTEIRKEIIKQKELIKIYSYGCSILPKLEISTKNIEYYSSLALYYTPQKLKNMETNMARLYLLCFIRDKLLRVNDHLVTSFVYRTKKYYKEAEEYAKDQIIVEIDKQNQNILKAGKLASLYANKNLPDQKLRPAAFKIVPQEEILKFVNALIRGKNITKTSLIWQHLNIHNRNIKVNLRPIFHVIQFDSISDTPIKAACDFMSEHIRSNKSFKSYLFEDIPTEFIPKKILSHIVEKVVDPDNKRKKIKKINGELYEYVLYQQIQRKLESGQVFVQESINYRSLESELIPHDYWIKNKDDILKEINLSVLNKPIKDLLKGLSDKLTDKYKNVNKNISNGNNNSIKIVKQKNNATTWKLPYKKGEETVNNPFYENLPGIELNDVIRFSMEETSFHKAFTHILSRYTKMDPEIFPLIATIVAEGTGIGINKMSNISDIKFNELHNIKNSYLTLFNLTESNNILINKISRDPIFDFYTLTEYGIHASVDGQKIETKYHNFKSRYSQKYFMDKGVVNYSLIANHLPINNKIIGANEHESHHLLDIVYNNSSDVEVAAISGDMHSINRVNFVLLYIFGYRFMPRFTKLYKKSQENLVSFEAIEEFKHFLIKPKRQANEALIIREWDNILRIIASLALKKTSQSIIVRKLSSHNRLSSTLKALIEFDKIIMSIYMLDYIDSSEMRSHVQRSLNRGEGYHQLVAAIRKVSGNKILGRNEIELDIHNECTRLIANCVIYYNVCILSKLYQVYETQNSQEFCALIKRLSPIAWQHIFLVGKYVFCIEEKIIILQKIIDDLIAHGKIDFSLQDQP